MSNGEPRVSIGLPVYNGENYLEEALEAILAQTFKSFELVISDNASTDRTEEICRTYADRDSRIRYYRNPENLGPAWNHNRVFELSTGEYFRWAAHDDLFAPSLIEKSVEVLDCDPSVVLCHARAEVIGEGDARKKYHTTLNTDSHKPFERVRGLIYGDRQFSEHRCYQVYGLIRSAVLKQTSLIGYYAHADGILLVQLAFLGRFYEIPEYLFFPRSHAEQSVAIARTNYRLYTAWFDPSKVGKVTLPRWRIFFEYLKAVKEASLKPSEYASCYLYLIYWFARTRRKLKEDLTVAAKVIWERRFVSIC